SVTGSAGTATHGKISPSASGALGSCRELTRPDSSRVAQVPQLPARQPKSIATAVSSASSSSGDWHRLHCAVTPERANVTSKPQSGCVAGVCAVYLTEAGPKASVWTRSLGTPQASRSRVTDSIIADGPQT